MDLLEDTTDRRPPRPLAPMPGARVVTDPRVSLREVDRHIRDVNQRRVTLMEVSWRRRRQDPA